jgi:hypothetical protein
MGEDIEFWPKIKYLLPFLIFSPITRNRGLCAFHTAANFLQKKFFQNYLSKKNFFWRGRNMKMVKIGTNRYKFTRFFVKYMFLPLQKYFFVEKKFFLRSCENKTSTCEHPFRHKNFFAHFCRVFVIIIQGCPNHTFGGIFYTRIWGIFSWYMTLKFGTQVEEVKIGSRNFFGVRIISGGFKMGLQRKNFTPGF